MLLQVLAIVLGLIVLLWSADRFIDGASAVAYHLGLPPLLIGAVVVGFGTSAPELLVSALAATQGNPGLALGNALGSNIANIGLILGLTALIRPLTVRSEVLRRELPVLAAVTALLVLLMWDRAIDGLDGALLLLALVALTVWSVWQARRGGGDALGDETTIELQTHPMQPARAWLNLIVGLLALMLSSRALVWGAVEVARQLGVSDLLIGLTVVAVGTSLPELASCVAAARKGEHDIALGNVLGSNLFNTLGVVGLAAVIAPMTVDAEALSRDLPVMAGMTLVLFVMGYGFRGRPGNINRWEATALLTAYLAYTAVLLRGAVTGAGG